ncbi:MAG: deoxyribodipyrimidine photo-lyase [Pseudomonadota bacterium]
MANDAAPILVWFRRDLRLEDNPALTYAASTGRPILTVYVREDDSDLRPDGGAALWWLHHSLLALAETLKSRGLPLCIRSGPAGAVLNDLVTETGAGSVVWNRRYEKAEIAVDTDVKAQFKGAGIEVRSFNAHLLVEPWDMQTKSGGPFRVFTPFWRALSIRDDIAAPYPVPETLTPFEGSIGSLHVEDLGLLPALDWADAFSDLWEPGEAGAAKRLKAFLASDVAAYSDTRDLPGKSGTSRLSPHLRFGEISPRTIWHQTHRAKRSNGSAASAETFLSEIAWREFSYHLLYYNPDLATKNYARPFDAFPWTGDGTQLEAWQRGLTGYPIVDAGMRELWRFGWMHNRVRMITASFLTKHLLIDWRQGEDWFWDTLVDADPASNAASWQWVSGSGADAAPYFRIFNPILQGEKFDPEGTYVRTHVPELAELDRKWLHKPWEAPASVLEKAGIRLGDTYPHPIVDHRSARQAALDAYQSMKSADPPALSA